MTPVENKSGLVAAITEAHRSFHRAVDGLADADLIASGVQAAWSVKDIAAHLGFWQRRAVFYLECARDGWDKSKNHWGADTVDNLNALNFEANRAKSLTEVMDSLRDAESSIQRLLELTSEDDLFIPARFSWAQGAALVELISNETFEHYPEHLPSLWAWRVAKLHADRKTRESLIDRIEFAHAHIDSTLVNLSSEQMLLPGVEELWSVKDILAHLVFWEQQIVSQLAAMRSGRVPQPAEGDNEADLNAQVYQQNRDRPLGDVLDDLSASHKQVIAEISNLAPESLMGIFPWADGEENWRLWDHIASETFRHFEDHGGKISIWMVANNIQS